MNEQWRSIPGYEGIYEASSDGRVKSLTRITDRGRKWQGRILRPAVMPSGYRIATLWRNGKQRTVLVHRLVLLAFVGEPPSSTEALHADGDRSNNTLANLSWGTHSRNQLDQVAHGTHCNASKLACLAGHPYDEQNTYTYPGRNKRGCRACRRLWVAQARRKKAVA